MPNVTGMNISEAKKVLKELGLEVTIEGNLGENSEDINEKIVIDQLPKKGIQVNSNTKVAIYVENRE